MPYANCSIIPEPNAGVEIWNRRGEKFKYAPLSVVPDVRALECFDWQGA